MIGDDVNLAARLEGLNKAYSLRLLASEGTFEASRETILFRPVDVVAVKGKTKGGRVYEPLALRHGASPEDERVAALCEGALDAWVAGEFTRAASAWDEVLALRPDDPVARTMGERAQRLAADPPAAWTGVFVAKEK